MLRDLGVRLRATTRQHRLAAIIIGIATAVMVAYEIIGYLHFMWPVLDLGLFNRHMWGLAHFNLGPNPLKGINLLADHSHFILVALVPLYWLWPSPVILLVTQGLAVGLSGIPYYLIARRFSPSKRLAALWLLPYYAYFGFWSMLGYPFHEVALAVPLLMMALYWLIAGRYTAMTLSLLGLMLVKEDLPLVVIMFGLYLMLFKRKWKLGAALAIVAGLYFGWLMDYWFPMMNHGVYIYADTGLGHGFGGIIRTIVLRPWVFVRDLLWPAPKLNTIILMLASFGLILPLLGWEFLLLAVPLWMDRALSTQTWRWLPTEHYSADQGPMLAVAATIGAARLRGGFGGRLKLSPTAKRWVTPTLIAICLIGSLYSNASFKPHYIGYLLEPHFDISTAADSSVWQASRLVPATASVGVQSTFPQLTSRLSVYQLPVNLAKQRPQYLLLSPQFNYYPFSSKNSLLSYLTSAQQRYGYHAVYQQNQVYLLQR